MFFFWREASPLLEHIPRHLSLCDEELLATAHEDSSSAIASASTTFARAEIRNF